MQPDDPHSKSKGIWAAKLTTLRSDGWDLIYTDGTGLENHAAAGLHTADSKHDTPASAGKFLGDFSTVADAERQGILLALDHTRTHPTGKVYILTDSTTALDTTLNLARGHRPRSGIEVAISEALTNMPSTVAVAWTRSHLGIYGNTQADLQASFHSHLGRVSLQPRTATHEGIKAFERSIRSDLRTSAGFGQRRTDWHRHALSALTWLHSGKGPQTSWLFHLKKASDNLCTCGAPETGDHITFTCPMFADQRALLLRGSTSWVDIHLPD